MQYNIPFRNRRNEPCNVRIDVDDNSNDVVELIAAETPFTTEMDAEDGNIYKAGKYQGATVSFWTEQNLDNLYSGKAHGVKVTFTQNNVVRWVGYGTPNKYNQPFVYKKEKMSLECVDGLSSLQYLKYKKASEHGIITLLDVVLEAVTAAECYKGVFYDDTTKVRLANNTLASLMTSGVVSEQAFFDAIGDGKKVEDAAHTYQEALEAVCTYLGLVAVADGEYVFLLDYDNVSSQNRSFEFAGINGETRPAGVAPVIRNITHQGRNISRANATRSLGDTYNKVTVKSKPRKVEDLIPNLFESVDNITVESAGDGTRQQFSDYIYKAEQTVDTPDGLMLQVLITGSALIARPIWTTNLLSFMKFLKCDNIKTYIYTANKNPKSYTELLDCVGCVPIAFNCVDAGTFKDYPTVDDAINAIDASASGIKNVLFFYNFGTQQVPHIENADAAQYPFLESKFPEVNTCIIDGEKSYMLITGTWYAGYNAFSGSRYYPIKFPSGYVEITHPDTTVYDNGAYMYAKLELSGQWWNGTTWQNTETLFRLPLIKESKKRNEVYFLDNQFPNTVKFYMGLKDTGYVIPFPTAVVTGTPKITLYKICDFEQEYSDFWTVVGALTEFNVKLVTKDSVYTNVSKKDAYTVKADEDNVSDMGDVEFTLTTHNQFSTSYTDVGYVDSDNKVKLLEGTENAALAGFESEDYDTDHNGSLYQEEHMLARLVHQYETPAQILALSMRDDVSIHDTYKWPTQFGNKVFLVNTVGYDYKECISEVNLIEKK